MGNERRAPDRGRWNSQRKLDVVLRLLTGEELDAVARELKLKPERIVEWRDKFLATGQAGLKSRETDDRDEEIRRLKAKIGDLTMDNELLNERIDRLENGSGVGAAVDFVAGFQARAPKWMQRAGLEWFYRLIREPFRMAPRYL